MKRKNFLKDLYQKFKEEDGINTIEIVLIVVVLVGLVFLFKNQITSLFTTIFSQVNQSVKGLY